MSENTFKQPRFHLPLSEGGQTLVGRIALMWAQTEFFLDEIIACAFRLPMKNLRALAGESLTSQRVRILGENLHLIANDEARAEASTLCCNLKNMRQDRNHIIHGMWGWHNPDHGQYEAAALSHKVKEPFRHSKLIDHHDKIAAETHRAVEIMCLITGIPKDKFHTAFDFGPTLPPLPQDQPGGTTPGQTFQTDDKSSKPVQD